MNFRLRSRKKTESYALKVWLPKISSLQDSQQKIDLSLYKDKPIEFAKEILQVNYLTTEQEKILLSIRDNSITNIQAGHGVGKSFCLSIAVVWYVFSVNGLCFTTAPSLQQVKDILWREIRQLYDLNRDKLGGTRGELFIRQSEAAKAIGYTARHTDSNAFQGRHSSNLLLVQDESDGISETIDQAMTACLTGSENKGVRIGNPLTANSPFHKACQISNLTIPVWTHPNLAWAYELVEGEEGNPIHRLKPEIADRILKPEHERKDDPVKPQSEWDADLPRDVIPGAVSIAWVEKTRIKYGEGSIYWVTRVEALFPINAIKGIIPMTWLLEARARYDRDPEYWDKLARGDRWRIGVDVGDGGDPHAMAVWRGCVLYKVKYSPTKGDREDVLRLATEIVEPEVRTLGGDYKIAVDRLGVGAGTLAQLKKDGYNVVGCNFGSSAEEKGLYRNRKTELFWNMRDGLRLGEIAIAPLGEEEDQVFEELAAIGYNTNTEKQIYCEPKDKTKAKIKRSPDGADAVVTAGEIKYKIPDYEQETPKNQYFDAEEQKIAELLELQQNRDYLEDISLQEANRYWQVD